MKILNESHPMQSVQRELFYILRDSSTNTYLAQPPEKAYKDLLSKVENLNKIFNTAIKELKEGE